MALQQCLGTLYRALVEGVVPEKSYFDHNIRRYYRDIRRYYRDITLKIIVIKCNKPRVVWKKEYELPCTWLTAGNSLILPYHVLYRLVYLTTLSLASPGILEL